MLYAVMSVLIFVCYVLIVRRPACKSWAGSLCFIPCILTDCCIISCIHIFSSSAASVISKFSVQCSVFSCSLHANCSIISTVGCNKACYYYFFEFLYYFLKIIIIVIIVIIKMSLVDRYGSDTQLEAGEL